MSWTKQFIEGQARSEICYRILAAEIRGQKFKVNPTRKLIRQHQKNRQLLLKKMQEFIRIGELLDDKVAWSDEFRTAFIELARKDTSKIDISLMPKSPIKHLTAEIHKTLALSPEDQSANLRATEVFRYLKSRLEKRCVIDTKTQKKLLNQIKRIVEAYSTDPDLRNIRRAVKRKTQNRLPGRK